ncbi:MAG TPA: methyltransferase domain-containing protein [Polyangiales bacterium]
MSTSSFFDDQHSSDLRPLPVWFRALRRFEVKREDVAAALLPSGGTLLDLGCADGQLVEKVAARFDQIVATDVSPVAIEQAEQRLAGKPGAERATFRVLDGNQPFPFPAASFDHVVSLSTLQYIFDPEHFLREAARVSKPRGHLLIEVPNMAYLPQRLRLLAGEPIQTSFWKHGIDGGNLHYFTLNSLKQLIEAAGFRVLRHTGSGVFAPLRTWRTSLLCGNLFVLAQRV